MNNLGSDVRQYSKAIKMNKYMEFIKETYFKNIDENKNIEKIKFLSTWIDNCITADGELIEYVRPYYKKCFSYRTSIDLKAYCYTEFESRERILIVHAPTNPEVKGSRYIITTLEKLNQKYDFEFKLIQGIPHNEAKHIYKIADIVIDQVILGEYGSLAVECMAMGKPVICWISDFSKEKLPKELPIVSASIDNLYEKVESLIIDSKLRRQLGLKGRNYVEKYHDINKTAKELINIYNKI